MKKNQLITTMSIIAQLRAARRQRESAGSVYQPITRQQGKRTYKSIKHHRGKRR